jgi:hypothetical protein
MPEVPVSASFRNASPLGQRERRSGGGMEGIAPPEPATWAWVTPRPIWNEKKENNMLGMKRITIAEHERGVLFRNRSFKAVLGPGVHWILDPLRNSQIEIRDLTVPEFDDARVDFLLKSGDGVFATYFQVVELADREVGLVYKNGKIAGVLAPGKRQLYWRGPIDVKVVKYDISKDFEIPRDIAKVLVRAGLHAFWKYQRTLKAELVDSRVRRWRSRVRKS